MSVASWLAAHSGDGGPVYDPSSAAVTAAKNGDRSSSGLSPLDHGFSDVPSSAAASGAVSSSAEAVKANFHTDQEEEEKGEEWSGKGNNQLTKGAVAALPAKREYMSESSHPRSK